MTKVTPTASSPSPPDVQRRMKLRYPGVCRHCRSALTVGTFASYDKLTKQVTCAGCARIADDEPATAAPLVTAPAIIQGVAGTSAQREYERRKLARATRIREAHPRIGGLLLAASTDPQSTTAWAVGARGERLVGSMLDELAAKGARSLHDRRMPGSSANIDHITVTARGVFVIDAKRYRARPQRRTDRSFRRPATHRLFVGGRDCTKLVEGMHRQTAAVRVALERAGFDYVPVIGMLCFVEADWPLFGGAFTIDDIRVLWPKAAAAELTAPGDLDLPRVANLVASLASEFPAA